MPYARIVRTRPVVGQRGQLWTVAACSANTCAYGNWYSKNVVYRHTESWLWAAQIGCHTRHMLGPQCREYSRLAAVCHSAVSRSFVALDADEKVSHTPDKQRSVVQKVCVHDARHVESIQRSASHHGFHDGMHGIPYTGQANCPPRYSWDSYRDDAPAGLMSGHNPDNIHPERVCVAARAHQGYAVAECAGVWLWPSSRTLLSNRYWSVCGDERAVGRSRSNDQQCECHAVARSWLCYVPAAYRQASNTVRDSFWAGKLYGTVRRDAAGVPVVVPRRAWPYRHTPWSNVCVPYALDETPCHISDMQYQDCANCGAVALVHGGWHRHNNVGNKTGFLRHRAGMTSRILGSPYSAVVVDEALASDLYTSWNRNGACGARAERVADRLHMDVGAAWNLPTEVEDRAPGSAWSWPCELASDDQSLPSYTKV